jgi:protein ImuA
VSIIPYPAPAAGDQAGARQSPRFSGFAEARAAGACAPLIEARPAGPGDGPAALGFALAWAAGVSDRLILWAAPEQNFAEDGALCAEGFAQFGVSLENFICVRTRAQTDALWAAEEALKLTGALVICTIAPARKALGLTPARRLLLAGEKSGAQCLLLRMDAPSASPAWMGWRITSAPSQGEERELGPPTFSAELARYRAGPAGQTWLMQWNAHDHAFTERPLDGDLAAAPEHGSPHPRPGRAFAQAR